MTITTNPSVRQVMTKLVSDPAYPEIARKRLIPWPHLAVMAVAYGVFIASTWAYLAGSIPFLLMLVLNQFAIYASFTPMHDAMHNSVSSNDRINDGVGTISIALLVPGLATAPFRRLHMEHHRWVGDKERDPDVPLVESPKWALPFIWMFPEILWLKFYKRNLARYAPKAEVASLVVGQVFYVSLMLGFLLSPWAMEFFLCWMVPQRVGMFILIYAFGHIQHPENADWSNAPFQTTVAVKSSPVAKVYWLGQTDHCIHHVLPHIPFHRYHKVWELGDEVLRNQGIPERGLLRGPREIQWPRAPYAETHQARVVQARQVGADIRTFVLEGVDGSLPDFTPGAHVDVHLPSGRIRQYSLCNAPGSKYQIAVKADPGGRGGSLEVHEILAVGRELTISEPRNNFELADAKHYVLVGGGIGVTPLLAMAHHLWSAGEKFDLHICAQNAAAVPFGEELDRLPFADRIRVHLDSAPGRTSLSPSADIGNWEGRSELYMCGPNGFMDWLQVAVDWPLDTIHRESFSASVVDVTDSKPFEVVLARSGRTLAVPANRQILDVLREHGVTVPSSCSQGVCGTCITPVLKGEPDHRDAVLSPAVHAANTAMCVCVSRAKSDQIVLDI